MHSRYPVAVHMFLMRQGQVLMLRRRNTGYRDGELSVVAGHVEPGESVTAAAVREIHEEVGLRLRPCDLRVVGVMHRKSSDERVDFFLTSDLDALDLGGNEPRNCEPEKCAELLWAPAAALPSDTIPYIRAALNNFRVGQWFEEFGWIPSK